MGTAKPEGARKRDGGERGEPRIDDQHDLGAVAVILGVGVFVYRVPVKNRRDGVMVLVRRADRKGAWAC